MKRVLLSLAFSLSFIGGANAQPPSPASDKATTEQLQKQVDQQQKTIQGLTAALQKAVQQRDQNANDVLSLLMNQK